MRDDLPAGTVTFLFTDVEGSTKLLHSLGAEGYADALAEHRRVIREACAREDGVEVDTQGDAFFFAFPTAPGALVAASAFTGALASGQVQVRVGLHTGTPLLTDEGYVGDDVHRAARIAASGHGGQVLVSAASAQLVERELRDLGEHRLKDLSAPERVYQLGDGDFPALKSLYRTNLPVPATPFLGREQELAEVVELLGADDTRLLTLTGPGGTGKTRLALQAAGLTSDAYPDGVYWIPLAPLRDATLVLATAGQTLGSKNGLAEHISDKAMLCLFDNFEQVVDAGPELAGLLAECPNLDVLVTSRERLRVSGEQTYPVPPLAESDGEALFTTRARAVDPAFTPSESVRELCLRLDELPLALELAAARTALFSPEQLLDKLSQRLDLLKGSRDADPRQQTLRATIEWSYDLLSDDERRLFRRLAVFSGGCAYEAAEEIAEADPDTLQSLLDKSLVRRLDSPLGPATGCSRRSASTQPRGSRSPPRPSDSHDVTSRTTSPSPRTSTSAARSASTRSGGSKRSATISAARSIPRLRSNPSRRSIWPGGLASTGTGEVSMAKGDRGSRLHSPRLPLLHPWLAFVHSAKPAISLTGRRI